MRRRPQRRISRSAAWKSFPSAAVLAPDAEQQLAVRARYSDGHTEDVTRWVKFSSSNEGVATRGRLGPRQDERRRRSGDHAVVFQPRALRALERRRFRTRSRPRRTRNFRGGTSSTTWSLAEVEEPAARAFEDRRRRHVPPPRLSSMRPAFCRRRRRSRTFSPTSSPDKRAEARRQAARAGRIRRLLGVQMVGPAAGFQPQAEFHGHVGVLRLDPRFGQAEQAVEPVCPGDLPELRQHPAERRAELLRPAQGPDRAHRERDPGVPRPAHHLRPLPQSPAGEVDADAVLPDGESVRARRREERRRHGRQRRVREDFGRHPASAPRAPAAADAARRPEHRRSIRRRTAAPSSPTG